MLGVDAQDRDLRLDTVCAAIGRRVNSTNDLTQIEIPKAFDRLRALAGQVDVTAQVRDIRHDEKPDSARRDQLIHACRAMAAENL